jgi:hypothetical protein
VSRDLHKTDGAHSKIVMRNVDNFGDVVMWNADNGFLSGSSLKRFPLISKLVFASAGLIRYTSVSVPYHIGNGWGGGLVPFVTSAAFAATGSIGYALIYPIAVPAVCFLIALFVMPETRKMSIWEPVKAKAAGPQACRRSARP